MFWLDLGIALTIAVFLVGLGIWALNEFARFIFPEEEEQNERAELE
jgi:hypothetical protein